LRFAARLEDVQMLVRSAAREVADAQGATVVLREGDRCFYADEDSISPLWKGQRFPIHECISGWAMLHDQPAAVPDILADDRIPLDAYLPTFVRSLAMVPMGHPPAGAVGVYWDTRHAASPDLLTALQVLADAAAAAVARIGLAGAVLAPNFADLRPVDPARHSRVH
jgi:GAF domain-containing protein